MRFGHIMAALTLAAASCAALAQSYPARPLRLIVPFPPGGTTDLVARIIAEPLARLLGQSVVVENKAGAGGAVGASEIARAAPDGYSIGLATVSTHGINPAVFKNLPYDALTGFAPIGIIASVPNVMVVHPALPAADMPTFIAHLKARPGAVNYASAGNGSLAHLMGESFKQQTGTSMLHVPYRGIGPATTDLLAGQVQVMFDNLPSSLPYIQAGRMRALAVASPRRLEALPNVPTFAELGLAASNDPSWFGLVAPAKTPDAVIRQLNQYLQAALAQPEVRARLVKTGAEPGGGSPEQFAQTIRREIEKSRQTVQHADIRVDETVVPVRVVRPALARLPLVFDSPHGGACYPDDFAPAVPLAALRETEDTHVNELFSFAPAFGVTLVTAGFPRSYIDPNRALDEIDEALFDAPWPQRAQASAKVALGKGLIWRLLDDGLPIYRRRLPVCEGLQRIAQCYQPYHAALATELDDLFKQAGAVWLVNCHSMPAVSASHSTDFPGLTHTDIVIGDRDGATCSPAFTDMVATTLRGFGYSVSVNHPYKGVEIVRRHGTPRAQRHALQLEINRRLYMNERTRAPHAGFAALQANLVRLTMRMTDFIRNPSASSRH